jgi:hypothetical protein
MIEETRLHQRNELRFNEMYIIHGLHPVVYHIVKYLLTANTMT